MEGLTYHASVTFYLQWHVSVLPWRVLSYIRLTEEDTTSSSRIFIKIIFQVMVLTTSLQLSLVYLKCVFSGLKYVILSLMDKECRQLIYLPQ